MNQSDFSKLKVTGETKVYFVIGDPIAQVRSTHLYNQLCSEKNIDAVFVPIQFSSEQTLSAINGMRSFKNLAGIIPTIPHKKEMMSFVDGCSDRSKQVEAINSIKVMPDGEWLGDTFDGVGYVNGLIANGVSVADRSFYLVGIGGAGSAIAFALVENGVKKLNIQDLDLVRTSKLVSKIEKIYPDVKITAGDASLSDYDVITNATPMGMNSADPVPVDVSQISKSHIVTDMIMSPPETKLLKYAAGKGCKTVGGYQALLGQARANMNFFGYD